MITLTIIRCLSALLIVLWVYSTFSKLRNINLFKEALLSQAFPAWIGNVLFWVLPAYELALAVLLFFENTLFIGMSLSFITLLLFTFYITGAVLDLYARYPCACGGIFRSINWHTHLIINIIYTLIALSGTVLFITSVT